MPRCGSELGTRKCKKAKEASNESSSFSMCIKIGTSSLRSLVDHRALGRGGDHAFESAL
jgi:hypothetical protein